MDFGRLAALATAKTVHESIFFMRIVFMPLAIQNRLEIHFLKLGNVRACKFKNRYLIIDSNMMEHEGGYIVLSPSLQRL